MIDDKCIENIIHKYFQQDDILTSHQIESYDNFIDNILPQIISQFFPLKLMCPKNGTHWNALERTAERTPNVAPVLVLPIPNRCGVGAHTRLNYNIILAI